MSISVVNGFVCFNCTDTEKAQKGIDPSNTTNDPSQNKAAIAKREETQAIQGVAGTNGAALAPGLGTQVDVSA
jgi:hypothetical protein